MHRGLTLALLLWAGAAAADGLQLVAPELPAPGAGGLQLIAPDLAGEAPRLPAPPPAGSLVAPAAPSEPLVAPAAPASPAAPAIAGIAAPHDLPDGTLAIAGIWLLSDLRQNALSAGIRYDRRVLQFDGVLTEARPSGDDVSIVVEVRQGGQWAGSFTCLARGNLAGVLAIGLRPGRAVEVAGYYERETGFGDCVVLTGNPDRDGARAQLVADSRDR